MVWHLFLSHLLSWTHASDIFNFLLFSKCAMLFAANMLYASSLSSTSSGLPPLTFIGKSFLSFKWQLKSLPFGESVFDLLKMLSLPPYPNTASSPYLNDRLHHTISHIYMFTPNSSIILLAPGGKEYILHHIGQDKW